MGETTGPQRGERVYYDGWDQPNGYVIRTRWHNGVQEVWCRSYADGSPVTVFEMEDFNYCWYATCHVGYWRLSEPPTPEEIAEKIARGDYRPIVRKTYRVFRKPTTTGA